MLGNQFQFESYRKKWAPILDHPSLPKIIGSHKRSITACMLENTQQALQQPEMGGSQFLFEADLSNAGIPANFMGASSSTSGAGGIDTFDPILISLVRRTMPNLIAYDICGVQPMNGPTGLVFALRTRYNTQSGDEDFYNEVNTAWSTIVTGSNTIGQHMVGSLPGVSNNANTDTYDYAKGMSTAQMEALGAASNASFAEMAFSIEKTTVTALGRALAAGYTMELAQDLKAIHGLEAEGELSNLLATEILAEINREIVRTIVVTAVSGAQTDTTTPGVFDLDVDANGRWSVEKFKGLMYQLDRDANQIAKTTRRGRGNIVICSSDVASALEAAGVLDINGILKDMNDLQVDDTGNTFVGILNKKYRVYIDPYAIGGDYFVIGYKGSNIFDAGIFYCPYVPLQMVRAVDPANFQPRIGFKTRYGVVANPFAQGLTVGKGALLQDSNYFYSQNHSSTFNVILGQKVAKK